mmetsp:Transcript_1952/g.3242  ORF Transcript_1952/g.3242 Transcript_1952/m.3242 type:complete len:555 (+) Transcript_1952:126-1790(+)
MSTQLHQNDPTTSSHIFNHHLEGNLVERGDGGEDGHVQQTRSHRVDGASRSVEGNHLVGSGSEVIETEAEVLVDLLRRRGQTELVHDAERSMGVTAPGVGAGSLNAHDGGALGEDAVSVVDGLGLEQLHARHRHHAQPDRRTVVLGLVGSKESLGDLHRQGELGASAHQHESRVRQAVLGAAGPLLRGVAAQRSLLVTGALDVGGVLSAEGDHRGSVAVLHADHIGTLGLTAVSRAEHKQVGHGAQRVQHLHRLVGGPVLAQTDAVVSHDVQDAHVRQSAHTHGAQGISDEVQEGRAEGSDTAVGEEAVGDGGHGVLSHSVVEVATGRVVLLESVRLALEVGAVGASEIGRTTDQLGQTLGQSVQNLSRVSASGGNLASLSGVAGQSVDPVLVRRQLAFHATLKLSRKLGVLLGVGGENDVPLSLSSRALGQHSSVGLTHRLGHLEALLGVKAELGLDSLEVSGAQGSAVNTMRASLARALANHRADLDHGGSAGLSLGGGDGLSHGLQVVDVGHRLHVPSIGLITLVYVLSERELGVTIDGDVVVVVAHNKLA